MGLTDVSLSHAIDVQAGDRLVIEQGVYFIGGTSSRRGYCYYGGTGSPDLWLGDANMNHPSWIEFETGLPL